MVSAICFCFELYFTYPYTFLHKLNILQQTLNYCAVVARRQKQSQLQEQLTMSDKQKRPADATGRALKKMTCADDEKQRALKNLKTVLL